ncbi:D-alanine-D-alanine ligase-like ATP-grasp enzyme [Sediminibacterium goheungense]|uniref:D-alanine-D-alanine ligase-like ATP-grasp enzyme n=2 Tax=Sediminibacterium goheungense TaxID=1086393 RepID=A0A4R6J4W1_9BACT|nr:D-alanine-D-alanine ligase-like ATP-grasp enzyme [Sediminibacterium goheungense]
MDTCDISKENMSHLYVWVLAPSLQTEDPNIDYYYDFSQSIAEYSKIFSALNIQWRWQPVTLADYATVIAQIIAEKETSNHIPVVLNLCDGDEINGTPGISVVKMLDASGLIYTGADEYFYTITTSKIPMKKAFDTASVSTAEWVAIHAASDAKQEVFDKLGSPLIVKPSISGGSMGVGIRNVVDKLTDLQTQVAAMFAGYRGWDLAADGLIAETFIEGPEYTTMIVGSWTEPQNCKVYKGVERVFHASLPEREKFLSFDRLWEIYEEETPMPADENFYEYREADAQLQEQLKELSLSAFLAVRGTGYTRVDIRQDRYTGKLYVLEVNAQCGLSEDENFTSIGAILRVNKQSFANLIMEIISEAIHRHTKQLTQKASASSSVR